MKVLQNTRLCPAKVLKVRQSPVPPFIYCRQMVLWWFIGWQRRIWWLVWRGQRSTSILRVHRRKRFASFPSPAGMSLPNSPWAGIMTSNLNYSCPGGVWFVTSRLETENWWTFFYGVYTANEGLVKIHFKRLVPIYVFPEMKLLVPKQNHNVLSPSFYTHISVRDLYISRIGSAYSCCREICGPTRGIYKSLTDAWMWKLGLRLRNS